jgi:PAS domain S-box-containing protein
MTPETNELLTTMRIDITPDAAGELTKRSTPRLVPRVRQPEKEHTPSAHVKESPYATFIESIYDAVLVADLNGKILHSNSRATEFLAYTREELYGQNVIDFVSGADLALLNSLLPDLNHQRFVFIKAYCIRKDKTMFPAEIAVSLLDMAEKQLCLFVRDITVREQTEVMLRTQHNAMEHAGNGIAIINIAGILTYVNPAMVQLWRYDQPSDLMGLDVRNLWADARSANETIDTVLHKQETWAGELAAKRKDGTIFDVQVSVGRNRNNDGHIVGLVFSFVDISERMEAFHRLQELSQTKSRFTAEATHELRTPLAIITEFIALVQDEILGPLNGKQKESLQSASRNCARMAQLINNMLDLAKIEAGKMEIHRTMADIKQLLKQCYDDFLPTCRSKKQALLLDLPDQLPAAYCDANSIQNVLINLVGNAQKFTPEGGTITMGCRQEGQFLCVAVEDTGRGIPLEAQQKIFEAFTQINSEVGPAAKGTGLGLTITKQLVLLNGGCISVNSISGKGSRFWFTLPLYDQAAPARVLIVDDEESVIQTIVYILKKTGLNLEIKSTLSGPESLIIAANFKPNLIMLDMVMPDMETGELLPALKRKMADSSSAILVMSDKEMAVAELREHGADDFLTKPFLPNELVRKVKLLLSVEQGAK